ncbi:DUF4241 domain-containing protein [Chitinophaga barathri]|uniref:DUF4241 domain-containing protein n=1 Tax=Chitinophaga barathri TaxID=1647451 RepID=A0A3N4M5D1_9BACT|nr:DUF4241 domain-containing protein [Chitinophaga barathri]RPD38412.1 DUF4241 domain-containing protein [Chitinophaga barathri]
MKFFNKIWSRYREKVPAAVNRDFCKFFKMDEVNGMRLEKRFIGKLHLPRGFIVACDPLLGLHDTFPFSRKVPPGEYPATMLMARSGFSRRNALLLLKFKDQQPASFKLAKLPGQTGRFTGSHGFFGFTADAGIGCVCDAYTQKHYNNYLERFFKDHPEGNIYDSLFNRTFARKARGEEQLFYNFYLPTHPQLNVIMFHTGYGDGIYPAYWGIGEDGTVCSLVIDFIVL